MVILDEPNLIEVVPGLLILAAWTIVTFVLALRFFRWT